MQSMWIRATQGWSSMRFLRLFLALSVVFQSFQAGDYVFVGLGFLLVLQTLLVAGCGFGSTFCGVPTSKETLNKTSSSVEYEEVSGK